MPSPRSKRSATWRVLFVLAATLWALALPVASWAASRPDPPLPISVLVIAVYGLGSLVCHQLPARSFHLWATQLPVCARCTGIYAGGALGAIVSVMGRIARTYQPSPTLTSARGGPPPLDSLARSASFQSRRVPTPPRVAPHLRSSQRPMAVSPQALAADSTSRIRLVCAAAALPTMATLANEWIGGRAPAGWVRALAGVPLGAAVAWLVVRGDEVN